MRQTTIDKVDVKITCAINFLNRALTALRLDYDKDSLRTAQAFLASDSVDRSMLVLAEATELLEERNAGT